MTLTAILVATLNIICLAFAYFYARVAMYRHKPGVQFRLNERHLNTLFRLNQFNEKGLKARKRFFVRFLGNLAASMFLIRVAALAGIWID